MTTVARLQRGLASLRQAIAAVALLDSSLATAGASAHLTPGSAAPDLSHDALSSADRLFSLASQDHVGAASSPRGAKAPPAPNRGRKPHIGAQPDSAMAASNEDDAAEATRLIALVELARQGDKEAFGLLYDHYHQAVFRFLYYRVGTVTLAEDLTAETFFRALRSVQRFRWQGKDFGAWLMTIARNLTVDHFKAGRTRLERSTEDMTRLDSLADGPENEVLASLTNERLLAALKELPYDQRECIIMRFLQGLSINETAEIMGRSSGAIKQLQLRGVRALAKLLPQDEAL